MEGNKGMMRWRGSGGGRKWIKRGNEELMAEFNRGQTRIRELRGQLGFSSISSYFYLDKSQQHRTIVLGYSNCQLEETLICE